MQSFRTDFGEIIRNGVRKTKLTQAAASRLHRMIVLHTRAVAVLLRRMKTCVRLGEVKPLRAPEVKSRREKGVVDGGCPLSSAWCRGC